MVSVPEKKSEAGDGATTHVADVERAEYDSASLGKVSAYILLPIHLFKAPFPSSHSISRTSTDHHKGDILSLEHTDPVLNAKMHLVNNAIDEIGFTPYQWKLFVLNGFGYAVDSLILLIQSIISGQAALEFHPGWGNGLTVAAYVGMLTGASFWGEFTMWSYRSL